MTNGGANFAVRRMCPVCKKETRQYTKDFRDGSGMKSRVIWCEECRVLMKQFKQTNGKWE